VTQEFHARFGISRRPRRHVVFVGTLGGMYCWSNIDYAARHILVAVEYLRMVEAIDQHFMSLNIALVSSALIRTAAYMQVVQW
jgi:hypothetical protein